MMTGTSFKGLVSQTSYAVIILHRKTQQDSRETVLEPSKPEKATRLKTLRKDRPIFLVRAQLDGYYTGCFTICSDVCIAVAAQLAFASYQTPLFVNIVRSFEPQKANVGAASWDKYFPRRTYLCK